MIIYVDTSAVVKLCWIEDGADETSSDGSTKRIAATSVITYPEACSALRDAARRRTGPDEASCEHWLAALEAQWVESTTSRVRSERPDG